MANVPALTALLLVGGAIGAVLFLLVFLVEGAMRPGYNAWRQMVSELSLGPRGWVQVTNFVVCGLLMVGFAVGLFYALPADVRTMWGAILLGVFGLSLILSGLFVGTPDTPQGIMHGLAGIVVFSSLPIASFVLAWRFAGEAAWRGWAVYSLVTGIVVLGMFMLTSVISTRAQRDPRVKAPIGLLQRVTIFAGWSWVTVLALRLLGL